VLIHGRLDLGSPLDTAWALARAWPDADLAVIDDSGHTGSDTGRERKRRALDDFARRSAATGLHDLAHSWHRGKIGSLRSWAGSPGQSIQTGFQRFRRRSHPRR
jgi:hypothetical protein